MSHKKIRFPLRFWSLIIFTAFCLVFFSFNMPPAVKPLQFIPPPDEANIKPLPYKILGETSPVNCSQYTYLDVLVDQSTPVPKEYVPPDLVKLNKYHLSLTSNDFQLRAQAADSLEMMREEMQKSGLSFRIYSAYRSYNNQEKTYSYWQSQLGQQAQHRSAYPGHSEHQLGTAVDLALENGNYIYPSITWNWLDQNAHKFGFVMSYRATQTNITGYDFEPWHWRFVGIDLATRIRSSEELVQSFYRRITCE